MGKYEVDLLVNNDNFRDGIRYLLNREGTILDNKDVMRHNINETFRISEYKYRNDLEYTVRREWCRYDGIYAYSYAFVYYKGELKTVCIIDENGKVRKYDADTFFEQFDNMDKEAIDAGRRNFTILAINKCNNDIKCGMFCGIWWAFLVDDFRAHMDKFIKEGCTTTQAVGLLLELLVVLATLGVSVTLLVMLYNRYKHFKNELIEEEPDEKNKALIKENAFKYVKDVLRGNY